MTDSRKIVVTTAAWLDPLEYAPPASSRLLLLTRHGVAILGPWGHDCVAWAPLPQISAAIRAKLRSTA